jgi:diguanylate cyclase (GGDEF)-like protein
LTQVNAAHATRAHDGGMRRPRVRALQGLALAVGSPLGWLALRAADGADPLLELLWRPGVYLYMLFGTALVFGAFGAYVGRQEERHRENSLHDALTDLYNTRYFWRRLREEQAFAVRHARPLALLVGDIDFFKRVNDRYGHAAGDRVLAAIADALMGLRRRGDTVARVGGEEFALILPETDLREAVQVAERLREAVAALRFDFEPGAKPLAVTMSFGAVANGTAAPLAASTLYTLADAAMYHAKQSGRNRVETTPAAGIVPARTEPAPAA